MIDLLALLKRLEWAATTVYEDCICPECLGYSPDTKASKETREGTAPKGHEAGCQLKAVIDLLEGRTTGEISFGVSKSIHIRPSPYADPL